MRYLLFLFFSIVVVSCKKKMPEDIGLPLLPGEDILNAAFTDTSTIIAHTVRDDSLRTNFAPVMLLGNANDPVFGITKSSIFTQLSLSTATTGFGKNPQLDSVVLSLVYNGGQFYGSLYHQKFKVYALNEPLLIDSSYYSNRMLQYSRELGSAYLVPKPNPAKDSVMIDSVKYPPQLRITLDRNFFQGFLNDTSFYSSNTDFQKFFKGIYISSSSGSPVGQGAILYMNLLHSYSRLTLFYHNTLDTSSYYFGVYNSACAYFTHFEHDYTSSPEITSQLSTNHAVPQEKVFIQPMAGLRTRITIPYLNTLFHGQKVVINKAELILPVDPASFSGADSIYAPIARLIINCPDSLKYSNVPDDFFEGLNYFGGDYLSATKEYRFNIARYVQQVLNGKIENQPLFINCYNVRVGYSFSDTPRRTTANRVVLQGGKKSNLSRMRLKISYTPVH
jgi:Domain of unknown function (DUF4270)